MGYHVRISTGVYIGPCPKHFEIDSYSWIDFGTRVEVYEDSDSYVKIGKYVHIAAYVVIQGNRSRVEIGDHVAIASGSMIYSASNAYVDPVSGKFFKSMSSCSPPDEMFVVSSSVKIEDYSFVGLNSVVLPGKRIGKGAIIGAGSIVLNDIPEFTIAVGAPAKPVKKRPPF